MPPSSSLLTAAANRGYVLRCFFTTRCSASEDGISELVSKLNLPRDEDHVLFTEIPEPFSTESACMALISDAFGLTRTRFVAIAGCPAKASRLKLYCSEQSICADVVEDVTALAYTERIIASQSRSAASAFQQAVFVPRTASSRPQAFVGPLRDIVDRLAPHSFPLGFTFKRHCSVVEPKLNAAVHPAPQSSAGLCFSDDMLAFTHLNTVIFRRSVNNSPLDVVVGAGGKGFKDGAGDEALFASPSGIFFNGRDGDGWLIADTLNHCVRCIHPGAFTVSTVSPSLFFRAAASNSLHTTVMPPVQLSHNPLKQRIFLALRRFVSRLKLPVSLTHVLEWIMTGLHFGRGSNRWQLHMSLTLQQFSEMSRFFRVSEINSVSHVPMWRPQRIYSDGAGGYVVVSQGRSVATTSYCFCL
jgi:hypothetical protein